MKNLLKIMPVLALLMFLTSGCTPDLNLGTKYNLYEIKQNNKIGFIDKNGKEIIEAKFENVILNNDENLIAVKFNGLWGFIDKKGEFKIIPQYKDTQGFKDGLAYVKDDNYEGYIDYQGKFVWKQAILNASKKTADESAQTQKPSNVKNDLADSILDELGL